MLYSKFKNRKLTNKKCVPTIREDTLGSIVDGNNLIYLNYEII